MISAATRSASGDSVESFDGFLSGSGLVSATDSFFAAISAAAPVSVFTAPPWPPLVSVCVCTLATFLCMSMCALGFVFGVPWASTLVFVFVFKFVLGASKSGETCDMLENCFFFLLWPEISNTLVSSCGRVFAN